MKTRTLGLMICAIGFVWMSTTIIAIETASTRYITQIMQENQAYGIPSGYSHAGAFQNTVDRLIDISRRETPITTTAASAMKDAAPIMAQSKIDSDIIKSKIS